MLEAEAPFLWVDSPVSGRDPPGAISFWDGRGAPHPSPSVGSPQAFALSPSAMTCFRAFG